MALIEFLVYLLRDGLYISDYDAIIAKKVAYVLTGGDVEQNTLVTEQYILDLEREAFMSLCGEEKTQARIKHMLETGRPLRN
jgi:3-hydroxyacyl-CoA dehydrogenase